MTPLALAFMEDLYREKGILLDIDPYNRGKYGTNNSEERIKYTRKFGLHLRDVILRAKFFECTEVYPLAQELAQDMHKRYEEYDKFNNKLAFLPDTTIWIECRTDLNRFATILESNDITQIAKHYSVWEDNHTYEEDTYWNHMQEHDLPLVKSNLPPPRFLWHENPVGSPIQSDKPESELGDFVIYALLALINTPRIIGQHQHFPHRREERERIKNKKLIGKFPLRAWTEIILKVALPEDHSNEPSKESHLTGEKCLHFCRSHIRIRNGMIEYVTGHWRGNPALGIKQSRYILE